MRASNVPTQKCWSKRPDRRRSTTTEPNVPDTSRPTHADALTGTKVLVQASRHHKSRSGRLIPGQKSQNPDRPPVYRTGTSGRLTGRLDRTTTSPSPSPAPVTVLDPMGRDTGARPHGIGQHRSRQYGGAGPGGDVA